MLAFELGKRFIAAVSRVDVHNPDAGRDAGADGEIVIHRAAEPSADRRGIRGGVFESSTAAKRFLRSIGAAENGVTAKR
jgi:hypothetical protein